MKRKIQTTIVATTLTMLSSVACAQSPYDPPTAFTYQGRLSDGSGEANGSYDLTFGVWTNFSGPAQVGSWLTNIATAVSNGVFTVTLDFGAGIFTGADRWLEIGVRTNGGGDFALLAPRQRFTSTPYAITAANVTGIVPNSSLSGTYSSAVTFNNAANQFTGSFSGNGSGVSNVNAQTLGGLLASDFWRLTGNNVAPGQFLGSTNNQPLEFRVNGMRALRVEFAGDSIADGNLLPDGAPNIIGGAPNNSVPVGVVGVTIAGGGATNYNGNAPNTVAADFGTIGGGYGNAIESNSVNATITGGRGNRIEMNSYTATVSGDRNVVETGAFAAAIAGGGFNRIRTNAVGAVIGGGANNHVGMGGQYNVIAGGSANTNLGFLSTISGGLENYHRGGQYSFIAGGRNNEVAIGALDVAIGGGRFNMAGGFGAAVPGGYSNSATANYSFAAGFRANAAHQGSFVWSDVQGASFNSSGTNQFLIRAGGGVGINNSFPTAPLHVSGSTTNALAKLQNASDANTFMSFVTPFRTWRIGQNRPPDSTGTTDGFFIYDQDFARTRLAVDASGRVGIGINEPSQQLHVNVTQGEGMAIDSSIAGHSPAIYLNHTGASGRNFRIASYGDNVNPGSFRIRDDTGGADRMVIDNAGVTTFPGAAVSLPANANGAIELGPTVSAGSTPFLDFHFGLNAAQDYNVRVINDGTEQLSIYRFGSATRMAQFSPAGLTVNGTFVSVSDRNAKQNFKPVSNREVLEKVASLPITRWSFQEDATHEHIGPMAQDFYAAFSLGADDKHIATVDADGVALAAIQGLNQKLTEELKRRDAENAELKQELGELKELVGSLANKLNGGVN